MKIFRFFCSLLTIFVFYFSSVKAIDFPEVRQNEKDLFPGPVDGHVAEINPPGFAWLPLEQAKTYKLIFTDAETKTPAYEFIVTDQNVFFPRKIFKPGKYRWTVIAYNDEGESLAQRPLYDLTIPEGLPELPFPNIDELLAAMSQERPRLIFHKKDLKTIRTTLTTTRRKGWKAAKKMAEKSLNLPLPKLPTYGPIEDYNLRRIE